MPFTRFKCTCGYKNDNLEKLFIYKHVDITYCENCGQPAIANKCKKCLSLGNRSSSFPRENNRKIENTPKIVCIGCKKASIASPCESCIKKSSGTISEDRTIHY